MKLSTMNNKEKANAKILREAGFYIFESRNVFWATHPKLISQYCVNTCADKAIQDLKNEINKIQGKFNF
jgi:hypothetical protein